jgi:hypothetical protein
VRVSRSARSLAPPVRTRNVPAILFLLILTVWEIIAWARAPGLLSHIEDVLRQIGWTVGSTMDLPTPARIDLALAWLTLFLAAAEGIDLLLLFLGSATRVFPNIPSNLTRWIFAVTKPKLVGALVSVMPLVAGIVIAKTVFT